MFDREKLNPFMTGTYFLSYPRSGSNWLCYIIEELTRYKVDSSSYQIPGKLNGKYPLIEKAHGHMRFFWKEFNPEKNKLIFMMRNYKECIVRHLNKTDFAGIIENLRGKTPLERDSDKVTDYMADLALYHKTKINA